MTIKELLAARTAPGKWEVSEDDEYVCVTMDGPDDYTPLGYPDERNTADARFIVYADRTIEAYEAVVEAARNYSPERDHDWRCEYRTAEVGWQSGDSPVIRCECGYDELQTALAALDTAKEAGR